MVEQRYVYLATLDGDDIDLRFLARCFSDESCRVVAIEGQDGEATQYQLHSSELVLERRVKQQLVSRGSGSTSASASVEVDQNWHFVEAKVERLLRGMHGAARLVKRQFQPVRVSGLHKLTLTGDWLGSVGGDDTWRSPYALPSEQHGLPELMRGWAALGLRDNAADLVLHLLGSLPVNWVMISVIVDVIAKDVGGHQQLAEARWLDAETLQSLNAELPAETPWERSANIDLYDALYAVQVLVERWLSNKFEAETITRS
ncbi:MAG: hypothetical protein QF797_09450 [Alphaproteobacteria bacterium]|jgi:hypothetical protein|nr:hypothetical protein [Rhodospirillaceae bacterium]MDP6405420.1 hypothetical protein [Alphaproteobacteria bacterium]MDP6624325.1 hypothetical protein [Alphaproteobacteria bacterium]|tara:strand:+ start:1241 stop:2017 length:777 start_codon:yes stop_codon:yes gene_type:complete